MARRDRVLEALAWSPLLQHFGLLPGTLTFFTDALCLTVTLLEAVNGCALHPPP